MKKSSHKLYYSNRGLPLVFCEKEIPVDTGVVTVENYLKWYTLQVVLKDGTVEELNFPEMEDKPEGEQCFVDHVPNPRAVEKMAHRLGLYIDPQSLDMMIGRWFFEVEDIYISWGAEE